MMARPRFHKLDLGVLPHHHPSDPGDFNPYRRMLAGSKDATWRQ
jgi:hypothetical protein